MPLSKEQKKDVVGVVKNILDSSNCITFVNFNRLSVEDSNQLRVDLRAKKVGYTVAKKTLARRALDEANIAGEMPVLDGEIALAYSEDILSAAQEIYGQQKKFEDKVSIVGGIFEGEYKNKEEMLSIAKIPGMQILRGQFVNLINSPIQGFVIALGQIAQKQEA